MAERPTPSTSRTKVIVNPGKKVIANPGKKVIVNPGKKVIANPGKKVIATSGKKVIATPGKKVIASSGKKVIATPGKKVIGRKKNPFSKNRYLCIASRSQILRKLNTGESSKKLVAQYGVASSWLSRIRRTAAKIRLCEKENENKLVLRIILGRELYFRMLQSRLNGEMITRNNFSTNVRKVIDALTYGKTSRAVAKWKFGKHPNFEYLNDYTVSQLLSEQFKLLLSKLQIEFEISDDNVYNLDETFLFWRVLPDEIMKSTKYFRSVLINSEKRIRQDRFTLAFCSNATGSHKLPAILINKYVKPRALKHYSNLPVSYGHNNNAWFDAANFESWYINTFKGLVKKHQGKRASKVLLLVDNFSGHYLPEQLMDDGYFKIIFLPPGTSFLIQPLDQGVITETKKRFRHKLLERYLGSHAGPVEFYADYDIVDCMELLAEAWNSIPRLLIYDSWNEILERRETQHFVEEPQANAMSDIEYEEVSNESVTNWINLYDQLEKLDEQAQEILYSLPRNVIEAEEIDRLEHYFSYITLSEGQIIDH